MNKAMKEINAFIEKHKKHYQGNSDTYEPVLSVGRGRV